MNTFIAGAVAGVLLLALALVVSPPREIVEDNPTAYPSGERAEPCDLEADRACNELIDVQGGAR